LRVPTLVVSPWIRKGITENKNLQHTSVIRTVTEMFGLAGPLNNRDESAASFASLLTQLSAPRNSADMPAKLDRPPLDQIALSMAAGTPVNPADEPLDAFTDEWVKGFADLMARRTGAALVGAAATEPIPTTQGEAAEFIDRHLRKIGI